MKANSLNGMKANSRREATANAHELVPLISREHRDAAVYGAKDLTELQARQMAQRLNEAYRRSQE
jgi:hypothetical protein